MVQFSPKTTTRHTYPKGAFNDPATMYTNKMGLAGLIIRAVDRQYRSNLKEKMATDAASASASASASAALFAVGAEVVVQRGSGQLEGGWRVTKVCAATSPEYRVVTKEGMMKWVTLGDLIKYNPL